MIFIKQLNQKVQKGVLNLSLKDTKIFIPEIPKEWTDRTRNGNTNTWNDSFSRNGLPEVSLDPPQKGLYAERFEDGWYWVCGCHDCLENNEPYSYVVCEEHDRCLSCGTPRKEMTEIPWGEAYGIRCKSCADKERERAKQEAIQKAIENNHSEYDCYAKSDVICPVCATKQDGDDLDHGENEIECHVCDTEFIVEVEYSAYYTSTLKD